MPSTVAQEMERWDPHAIRWRLQAYRLAAESVLEGLGGAPDVSTLHRDLLMPLADAEGVVARVRAELQL